MRPAVLSVAASPATSTVYPVDIHREAGIALMLKITGTGTVSVEHTFDDVFAVGFDPSSATWIEHATLKDVSNTTPNVDSNYAYLPRGIRLKSKTGTCTATLTIIQMGLA
jgi:hypothetical protein